MVKVLLQLFLVVITLFCGLIQAEVLSVHCPIGCPSSRVGNDMVFRHLYALSNNPNTKLADWVAYEVSPINYGLSPGRHWMNDSLLNPEVSLELGDYSGANKALGVDRGHQAPLASFAGSRYWYELNFLSNITPQKNTLNQGAWKRLEIAVREGASYQHPLLVITGPIFQDYFPLLPSADELHRIPVAYFKTIYNKRGDSVSFVLPQTVTRSVDYCQYTVKLLKLRNELTFNLPTTIKNRTGTLMKRIGCGASG